MEQSKPVGKHGPPCPTCGDTWQWPTYADALLQEGIKDKRRIVYVCATCFVEGKSQQILSAQEGA